MSKKTHKKADWEFVFDGVFGFLSSPLWSVPMMSFIDAQCVVFEPSEENHLEWTAIHIKYRALVESLLTSYLQDVGITEQEFMKACTSPSVQRSVEMQSICEQLFAGEDFEVFKKMMTQRNVELELEALKLIQKRQGGKRNSNSNFNSSQIATEEEILQEVIRRSEEEYKESQRRKSAEDVDYNETIEKMIISSSVESERLEQEVVSKQEETKRVVQESIERDDTTSPVEKVTEDVSQKPTQSTKTKECVPDVIQKHSPSINTKECVPDVVQKPTPCTKAVECVPDVAQQNIPSTNIQDSGPTPSKSPSISAPDMEATELSSSDRDTSPNKTPRSPTKSPPLSPTKSPPLSPIKVPTEKPKLPDIKRDPTSSEAADQWLQNAKDENASSSTASRVQKNANLSSEDIKKREEYLKQQRDRIQKMKNQEREKQLLTYTNSTPQRPVSARVARDAVSGDAQMSADEKKQLAMRRVLAEKLKKEVIYKDDV